jgi:hypothetical protein
MLKGDFESSYSGVDLPEETVRERQIRVQKAGGDWEEYVRLYLNEKLKGTDMEVIVGKDEEVVKRRSKRLWKMLSMPIKASTVQESAWGDIDLVAVRNDIPIAVISCKVSLHGRFTETLFWSLLFRMLTRTKVVLATPDGGRGQGKWSSEWGTSENPTKDRLLAESYLEGVYVENVEAFCKNKKPEEKTVLGGIVRALDELPQDLVKWSDEILRFTHIKKDLGNF